MTTFNSKLLFFVKTTARVQVRMEYDDSSFFYNAKIFSVRPGANYRFYQAYQQQEYQYQLEFGI